MSKRSRAFAQRICEHVLRMTHQAKASHVGSCLSIADVVAVLYQDVLDVDPSNPEKADRDRFILSKGHATAIVYAALAERGFFPLDWLARYCDNASPLSGHITHQYVPGVEVSTGSLGHGLPIGCGLAYAIKYHEHQHHIYVVMSDGELNEGSNWESILFAGHHELDHLIAIVDYNKIQSFGKTNDILNLEPLTDKWKAFNWHVQAIDGHNHDDIQSAIQAAKNDKRPSVIIAHTVKGHGVGFMENELSWHYRSPKDDELDQALADIQERYREK